MKEYIPPQAIELEASVLGAMMIDKKAINTIVEYLPSVAFYKPEHIIIYSSILEMYRSNIQIDLLTVADFLKAKGDLQKVGGEVYLINLTQKVASSAHIDTHGRIILQMYVKREIIYISNKMMVSSYDETSDIFEILDNAYTQVNNVSELIHAKNEREFKDIKKEVLEKAVKLHNKEIEAGIPTPIKSLSEVINWNNSDLIILAARPGMGKTSFILLAAKEAALNKVPTAFFSLEMSETQLVSRILSIDHKINGRKFTKYGINEEEFKILNNSRLNEITLFIDDTPSLSIFDLRVKAKRLASQHGIKLIVIDYLQLMTAGKRKVNREQEISLISKNLKALAKELDIPVIALSQLSRAVETRGGSKRPLLSDLRESGAIEQDADIVSFIFRPEYYGQTEWDDDEHTTCIGQAEIIIAKHRSGSSDTVRVGWDASTTRFYDLEESEDDNDNFFDNLPKPTIEEAFGKDNRVDF